MCDPCLTNFEIDQTSDDSKRVKILEEKVSNIDNKLNEITFLLKEKSTVAPSPTSSVWHDTDRVEEIKNNLVVVKKKSDDSANKAVIEEIVLKNDIAMKNSYENKTGDLVLICDSSEETEKLKSLVKTNDPEIQMHSPRPKMKSVSIVGMPVEYSSTDFINRLKAQNSAIRKITESSKLEDHVKFKASKCVDKILAPPEPDGRTCLIKLKLILILGVFPLLKVSLSLKNDESKFQVFCLVSNQVMNVFENQNNKIMIGLNSCKVYEQNTILRCFNCQEHGHTAKSCTFDTKCGKCAQYH